VRASCNPCQPPAGGQLAPAREYQRGYATPSAPSVPWISSFPTSVGRAPLSVPARGFSHQTSSNNSTGDIDGRGVSGSAAGAGIERKRGTAMMSPAKGIKVTWVMRLMEYVSKMKFISEKFKIQLYPPFFLMRVSVDEISNGWRRVRCKLPLNVLSRNPGGVMCLPSRSHPRDCVRTYLSGV